MCLPITIAIMVKIKAILSYEPHKYHNIMMWAVCYITSFAFFHCMSSLCKTRKAMTLSYNPFAVDYHTCLILMTSQLKQSKSDPF